MSQMETNEDNTENINANEENAEPKAKGFWAWCKRYLSLSLFLVIGCVVYIIFFSDYPIVETQRYRSELSQLKKEIKQCEDSLEYYRNMNKRLDTDPETMEKIVREDYHMQHTNEDIYLVR